MKTEHKTRGSAADRELACAGAIGWDGPHYSDNSPEARTGTIVHDALSHVVAGIPIDVEAFAELAPDPTSARIAIHTGIKIWREVGDYMPHARAEQRLEGNTTRGTADVLSLGDLTPDDQPSSIAILDWKLGQSDDEHPNQLRTYALAAVDQFGVPETGYVDVIEAWLMKGAYQVNQVTMTDLDEFRGRLERQHAQAGKQFSAGPHCKYCPIRVSCTVRDEYLQASAAAILKHNIGPVTRETLGRLWYRSRDLKRALAEYDKAIKVALDDGPIPIGDGRQIVAEETERVVISRPSIALELLRDVADIDLAVTISKASIERGIKALAPKGQGAGRVRIAMATLEQQGATETKTIKTVKAVKA